MSRSNPRSGGSKSPVKYRFKFNAKEGKVSYYDSETKKDVVLDELTFTLLDRRSSITGWSDADTSAIYSNFVTSTKTEELQVKTSKRTLYKGLYENFKNEIKNAGGDFTTNLFMLTEIDGEMVMGNLQLSRSGLKGWMTFEEGKPDIYANALTISKGSKEKKGSNNYFLPDFSLTPLTPEQEELATEKDKELQAYFKNPTGASDAVEEEDAPPQKATVKDDLPF